jgi:hypothetical protein
MARLDAGGTIEELIALGGEEDDLPTSLSVSDSGSIVLAVTAGRAFRADNIELETFENKTGAHAFIFRFDDNFRALWKAQITGEEYGHIASVRQDPQGSIYAAGSFNLRLLAEDTVLLSKGYSDGFLIKYGPEGKVTWARDFGTWYFDYASQLIIDNLGGTMITGSMGDTLLIDDLNVNPLSGNNSALVIQFSSDGRATWADCISGNGRNFSDGAVIDRKGNLYLTGAFRGVFEKESDALTSHGDQDIFVAKYFNCPESESEIKGDRVICPGLPAHLSVDDEYSHVVWNDTLSGEHYIVAEKPGIYRVTMMDKQGCVQSDSVELILAAEPDFTLGNDVSLPVESLFELKSPDGFRNYRWQDNSENQTFMAQAVDGEPGTVICWLTAVDSLGCPVSDTITVEFYLEPQWLDPNTVVLITYPNPVAGWLSWSINVDQPCRLFLELTDNNGKPVVNHYIGQYQPGSIMKTDLSNIPSGVYFLRLRNSTGQASESVCIIRQ